MRKPAPIGEKFGRLIVLKEIDRPNKDYYRYVECKCDCGTKTIVNLSGLRKGRPQSCGCLRDETAAKLAKVLGDRTKHGLFDHSLYRVWSNMKARCHNPKSQAFDLYGGRGIEVCDKWRKDFVAFYNWAVKRWKPGLTLDRIDNDGNYCPSNCRFTTYKVQNNNSRNNRRYRYKGENLTVKQIAEKYDISWTALKSRLQKGWKINSAVTTPQRVYVKNH